MNLGFQDVLEVTSSLEKQRTSSEEDPIKESSHPISWSFDPHLTKEIYLVLLHHFIFLDIE